MREAGRGTASESGWPRRSLTEGAWAATYTGHETSDKGVETRVCSGGGALLVRRPTDGQPPTRPMKDLAVDVQLEPMKGNEPTWQHSKH